MASSAACRVSSSGECGSTPNSARSWPDRLQASRWRTRSPRTTIATASSTSRSCPLGSTPPRPREARAWRGLSRTRLDYIGVLAVELFVSAGALAGERARTAPRQQRALDARRRRHRPVRPADPRRHRFRVGRGRPDGTRGRDGQPARRPVVRAQRGRDRSNPTGPSCSPSPPRGSTCTGSRGRGPAARWGTSRSSPTTPTARPPPPGPSPCPRPPPSGLRPAFGGRSETNPAPPSGADCRRPASGSSCAGTGSTTSTSCTPSSRRAATTSTVHAMGRPVQEGHCRVRVQGRRRMGCRRDFHYLVTYFSSTRHDGIPRRLRPPRPLRTGSDRDRLLAAAVGDGAAG